MFDDTKRAVKDVGLCVDTLSVDNQRVDTMSAPTTQTFGSNLTDDSLTGRRVVDVNPLLTRMTYYHTVLFIVTVGQERNNDFRTQ
jgi:hypothetical protein